ncbi:MAG: GGDEF domain-containing protein [Microthrixaceae bacterium]
MDDPTGAPPPDPADVSALDERWCEQFASANAPDGVVLADPSLGAIWANTAALQLLGHDLDSVRGHHVVDFVHPEDLDQALGAVAEASRNNGYHMATRMRVLAASGDYVDCRVNANTVERHDGVWFVLGVRSVGDEDAIETRRRKLRGLATTFYVDCASMEWVEEPQRSEALLGGLGAVLAAENIELSEFLDDDLDMGLLAGWAHPDSEIEFGSQDRIIRDRADAIRLAPCEYTRDALGVTIRIWLESANETDGIVTIRFVGDAQQWDDANADVVSLMCSSLMATVRRCRRERALAMAATRDPLTGLLNRTAMEQRLEELIAASRLGAGGLAVFFADLDRFKQLNDTRGHQAGDEVLRRVADGLEQSIRPGDIAARIGGDEFVVVMLTRHRSIDRLASRIRSSVAAAIAGFSEIGVALGAVQVRDGETSVEVLARADAAMYADKRRRRGLEPARSIPGTSSD